MGRILWTNGATEDLVEIFAEAAERSPQLLDRRRAAFDKSLRPASSDWLRSLDIATP